MPTITTTDDVDVSLPRPRSGTWGSKSDSKQHNKEKDLAKHKKHKKNDNAKSKHESKSDTKKRKDRNNDGNGSRNPSRSNSAERRKSGEDVQSPKKVGMLDAFRSRSNSDEKKKKGSAIMRAMFVVSFDKNFYCRTSFVY